MPQAPMRPHRQRGDYTAIDPAAVPETTSPDWSHAVDAFLRDARSRNCSPATVDNYRTYLRGPRAEQFLKDYRIRSVADVTPGHLRDFQAELLDAGLSSGTAATFHRIIRNFLGFCRREGWGVAAETLGVAPPQQATVEPETYTEAEEQRILAATRTGRDRFLVEFMLRTGLRLSEVAAVTLDDVVTGTEGSYLRVGQGAVGEDRIIPLDTGTYRFSETLHSYVRDERPAGAKDRHLFLTTRRDRVSGNFGPLEAQGIKMLLRRIGEATGIHVHAYAFRHTFATRALAAGVDRLVLQRALGQSSPAMVNRYLRFQDRDVLDAWRARSD
jgi:site-specific recombinase XerD